ncbi:hypothetical protein, partial [Xanthomonas oryzae]|uniref:hypothetical protein n=1 Tax=Xanthomonas oryzae TaxID=347 RepID=UPI0021160711
YVCLVLMQQVLDLAGRNVGKPQIQVGLVKIFLSIGRFLVMRSAPSSMLTALAHLRRSGLLW